MVPELPEEGVDFLLGNDLAGTRVRASSPCERVTSSPVMCEETEQLTQDYPGICPACVTTRSMTRTSPVQSSNEASKINDENSYESGRVNERDTNDDTTFFGNFENHINQVPVKETMEQMFTKKTIVKGTRIRS